MKVGLRTGDIKGAAGSAYVELDDTKVFAAVYGPIEPENQDSAMIGVVECCVEDVWNQKAPVTALQHKLRHTFAATICGSSYLKTLIRITISIVNAGSVATDAAILAGSLALADAGIEMTDFVVSCTVGLVDGAFVPFGKSDTQVRVALMPPKDEVIETEVVGAVDPDAMMAAIDVASAGCRDLTQAVRNYLSKCVQ